MRDADCTPGREPRSVAASMFLLTAGMHLCSFGDGHTVDDAGDAVVGEHCELEERDGHHVLQCAWARVKRVLTDYDFTLMPPKEQVLQLHDAVVCVSVHIFFSQS